MKEPVNDFRDLIVWQRAIELAKCVYALSRRFPPDERFCLTNQIRRAAVSVSSNIAEGHSRTGREFRSFLSIARGSSAEVQSQLILAAELGFIGRDEILVAFGLCGEIQRMTAVMIGKLTRP